MNLEKRTVIPLIVVSIVMTSYMLKVNMENGRIDEWRMPPKKWNSTKKVAYNRHDDGHKTRKVNGPMWISVGNGEFSIFSVIGEQSLTTLNWHSLVFNGLEKQDLKDLKYKCCYRYLNGSVASVLTGSKRYKFYDRPVAAAQVICDISNRKPPTEATLVSKEANCYSDATYNTVIYRTRDPEPKLAICGKMAYEGKDSKELVEWIEFHLHFGGGPISIYAYADLNANAMKVMDYYDRRGLMEKIYVPYVPILGKKQQGTDKNTFQRPRRASDVSVTDFDFQQRMRHYSSYSMIDMDEFIVPRVANVTSYVQLVDYIFKKYPKAAYLSLKTEVHLKDWEKTDPNNSLILGQYEYHTEPKVITEKNIFLPDRIKTGTMWHHNADPLPGFTKPFVDPNFVVLKHYRYCKDQWFHTKGRDSCLRHFKKLRGHIMGKVAKQIENKVLNVIKELGL